MIRTRVLCFSTVLAFAASVGVSAVGRAQVTTDTTNTPQSHTMNVDIERAQVVYASGDDVVLRMQGGGLRLFEIPAGTSFTVDGKPATVSDLTVGSTISHARISTRTESDVTTVTQISGVVTRRSCPFVTLRLDDGTSKVYRIPADANLTIEGQQRATCGTLRNGSRLNATVVTTEGLSTVNKNASIAARTPPPTPPPATPPQQGVLLILKQP